MFIITVIPIEKGPFGESLTYFYPKDIPIGYIVSAPLRSRNINAIVVGNEEILNAKTDIKNADFTLKKITKVIGESPFSSDFFLTCEKMGIYTTSNTGSIIRNMIPVDILENLEEIKRKEKIISEEEIKDIKQEKLIFQSPKEDRIAFYKTLIREAFAKKESVFICMPTKYDIEIFESELKKGIEQYVFSFHSDIKKKKLINDFNKCISIDHPILIIGTGKFLFIDRNDIKTMILEHESSESYKQFIRPYLDIRGFVESLSFHKKTKLIIGDEILRPETLWRHEEKEFGEISSPIFRLPEIENRILVDMKEEIIDKTNKKFAVLGEETIKTIEKALTSQKSVFLFSVRKGLAPITICYDCGNTLLCPSCDTPIVLYNVKNKENKDSKMRIFMCNKCGKKEKTEIRCPKCNSWNLTPLGIGTERVEEEIKNLFPKINIYLFDKESVNGDKEAKEKIEKFKKEKSAILIGTELVFSYLDKKIGDSVVVSFDGLMSIPSFNMTQKIIHIIEKLNNITENNLIIQTRNSDNPLLKQILAGNVLPLYRQEIKERKDYNYPPFKRLIKITFQGTKQENEKARSFLNNILGGYDPQIFSAFIGKQKGEYVTNTIIRIEPKLWQIPNTKNNIISIHLRDSLLKLPPSFSINIDPEDLL
ncbi:MAG: hypothetical protein O210_OD1C00001G0274 [Parcubacteria bacterium RAAC4_OD1_1]|nr:MAG: hypothetical protein O210_OD1C00001G0274 [Parcubacteria bacterium RAAC4_OD1_1]